jgi:hypothetical protein
MSGGASRLSVDEDEAFERACRIWFRAPEGRAAQELRELPTDERERVWADLTGNQDISNFEVAEEDTEQMHRYFTELRKELFEYAQKQPAKALSIVINTSPNYIHNPPFMLKFLRAQGLNVRSTLALMARHFELKRQLFGVEKVHRDILLSDLNEYDMEFLRHGAYQYLQGAERAGRSVSFLNLAEPSYSSRYNVVRQALYSHSLVSCLDFVTNFLSFGSFDPSFI